ncbi:MAG: MBL fold metallo-hydrolase [Candidatus Neomarinimicrobiota bacterium]|nr:MBL fold metallo-hydrolase [Candidatus Neomarinimicrobiota bacterium]
MSSNPKENRVLVLGTSQDGGYPQVGCSRKCCIHAWENNYSRKVSSLAIISDGDCWLVDITPDFPSQLKMIESEINGLPKIAGIFITHAHVGHYLGLLDLGLEIMNTNKIPVYVMPSMGTFLKENGPFKQLVDLENIKLMPLIPDELVFLKNNLLITPFLVPHRNEFSETVGYKIHLDNNSLIYIPDIDSWEEWDGNMIDLVKNNDVAILDGTFYDGNELEDRKIEDIPHPCIKDSLKIFSLLEVVDRKKVYFTHLNHTNPVIQSSSSERLELLSHGYNVAEDGMVFKF